MFKTVTLLVGMVILSTPVMVEAKEMMAPATGNVACSMKDNVTISVQFNFTAISFKDAKSKFDAQTSKVMELAKQQQIQGLEVQGQSYNIYSNSSGGMEESYAMNGNMTYKMDNSEMAFKFADFLKEQKFKVGINSNSYRQGNCTTPAAGY